MAANQCLSCQRPGSYETHPTCRARCMDEKLAKTIGRCARAARVRCRMTQAEAAEAEARALRRRITEERGPGASLPRQKRRPQRLPPSVVPVTDINVARAEETARRMKIALPAHARKP